MAYTNTWDSSNEASPADSDPVSEGAEKIRDLKKDVRERVAKDHYMDIAGTDADHGEHSKVTFQAPIATPSNVANKGFLYGKDVGGKIELHFLDEDGNEIQLTSGGIINSAILKSLGTTKGDIIVFTASGTPVRLGVGSDGQIVKADSAESEGIKWVSVGSLATPAWTEESIVNLSGTGAQELATGLPSGILELEILINGLDLSAPEANGVRIQLGDSGGYETTGYASGDESGNEATTGFIFIDSTGSTRTNYGIIKISRWDAALHTWLFSSNIYGSTTQFTAAAGVKTLSAELTQIRIYKEGAGSFSGSVRVRYR